MILKKVSSHVTGTIRKDQRSWLLNQPGNTIIVKTLIDE